MCTRIQKGWKRKRGGKPLFQRIRKSFQRVKNPFPLSSCLNFPERWWFCTIRNLEIVPCPSAYSWLFPNSLSSDQPILRPFAVAAGVSVRNGRFLGSVSAQNGSPSPSSSESEGGGREIGTSSFRLVSGPRGGGGGGRSDPTAFYHPPPPPMR